MVDNKLAKALLAEGEEEPLKLSLRQRLFAKLGGFRIEKTMSVLPEYVYSPEAQIRKPKFDYVTMFDTFNRSWIMRQISRAIIGEVVTPGWQIKARFKLKCRKCDREYQTTVNECDCGNKKFDKPDWKQRQKLAKLIKKPNSQHSFEDLLRSTLQYLIGLDDFFYYIGNKELMDNKLQRVLRQPEEVWVEDSRHTFPVSDLKGRLGNDEYFCLLPGQEVVTEDGYRTVEDIELTMRNSNVKLLARNFFTDALIAFQHYYKGESISIKPMYLPEAKVTHNHPILVTEKLGRKMVGGEYQVLWSKPHWVNAENIIALKHYILMPKLKEKEKQIVYDLSKYNKPKSRFRIEKLELNETLASIFGWYLAEGYAGKCGITFSLGKHEMEYIKEIEFLLKQIPNLGKIRIYENETTMCITVNSTAFASFLKELLGTKALNKHLPKNFLFWSKRYLEALIKCYVKGDGHEHRTPAYTNGVSLCSASKRLIKELQLALLKLNIPSSLSGEWFEGKGKICGREVQIHGGLGLNWLWERKRKDYGETNEYFYFQVRDTKREPYKGFVYNFMTHDKTYGLPFIVHNCPVCYDKKPEIDSFEKISGWSKRRQRNPKCPKCRRPLVQTAYVQKTGGKITGRFGEYEIIHGSMWRILPELFGNTKLASVWILVNILMVMDEYNYEVYSEGKVGKIIGFPESDQTQITKMKTTIENEINRLSRTQIQTGKAIVSHRIRTIFLGGINKPPVEVKLMEDLKQMQSLEFYTKYATCICGVYGVTPEFVALRGRKGITRMEIDVQNRVTKEYQNAIMNIWNNQILSMFDINDWIIAFGSIEKKDELREAQILHTKAATALTFLQSGFDVEIDDLQELTVSGKGTKFPKGRAGQVEDWRQGAAMGVRGTRPETEGQISPRTDALVVEAKSLKQDLVRLPISWHEATKINILGQELAINNDQNEVFLETNGNEVIGTRTDASNFNLIFSKMINVATQLIHEVYKNTPGFDAFGHESSRHYWIETLERKFEPQILIDMAQYYRKHNLDITLELDNLRARIEQLKPDTKEIQPV